MIPDYHSDGVAKRTIRRARVALRGLYFLCSCMTLASSIIALILYEKAANLFPEPLEIWPTLMIMIVAFISFALCLAVLISYFISGTKMANVIDRYRFFFHWSTLIGFIIVWAVTTSIFHVKSQQPQDLWHASCFAATHDLIPGTDIWIICNASKWVSGCGFTLVILPLQALRFKLKRDIDKAEQQPMSSFVNYERESVDERLYHHGYGKVQSHSFDSIRLQAH
jgi:hypothetical protein